MCSLLCLARLIPRDIIGRESRDLREKGRREDGKRKGRKNGNKEKKARREHRARRESGRTLGGWNRDRKRSEERI